MTFRLYSSGKLAKGIDENQALAALQRVTRMPEAKIREQLLNGHRRKLASDDDGEKLERLRQTLEEAGLIVELVSDRDFEQSPIPRKKRLFRRLIALTGILLLLMTGAGIYGWYWLNKPLTADALAVEEALAEGNLVAIGHADIRRITFLMQQWTGSADPEAIPVSQENKALMEMLFTGSANFRENLHHAFLGVHSLDEKEVVGSLVLTGDFDEAAILGTLKSSFYVESVGSGRWSLKKKPEPQGEMACPKPEINSSGKAPASQYLQITPHWLLLSSSKLLMDSLFQRLSNDSVAAVQELELWRKYRTGQLASFMIFIPETASKLLDGFPGMAAQNAAKESPQITRIATRIGISPMDAGLHADVMLTSLDRKWNQDKGSELRRSLKKWSRDSQTASPSLTKLLTRVSVKDTPESLLFDMALDREVLGEIGQAVQEAFAAIFSVKVRKPDGSQSKEPVADEIMPSPIDYSSNYVLARLPDYEIDPNLVRPLFVDGSFAANIESINLNKEKLFELKVSGEVALPKSDNFSAKRVGSLALGIEEVQNAAGEALLRDERCLEMPAWNQPNHEPVVSEFLFNDKATVNKSVRLKKGVKPESVAMVKGRLVFFAPVKVKRFVLPLEAGSEVKHMGLRFYLNRVSDDGTVSFQISGEKKRFLELRALNKNEKPLQRGWAMRDSDESRVSQQYKGKVRSLEVYIAEEFVERESHFILKDIFSVQGGKRADDASPTFVPENLDAAEWDTYLGLELSKLHADPKDREWHRWSGNEKPIAGFVQSPVAFDITHKVEQWGNNPKAELYYPMLTDLPGVLSAVSYRIEVPKKEDSASERFLRAFYSYNTASGEVVVQHQLGGRPFARQQVNLVTGLAENQRLQRLKGRFRFRLPLQTKSHQFNLDALWQGKTVDGVKVTLKRIGHGMFPGYAFEIDGSIENLVNLYGLTNEGDRIDAEPINFQDGGYWTLTLPFNPGMNKVELVLATEQKVYDYPFDLRPEYPADKEAKVR